MLVIRLPNESRKMTSPTSPSLVLGRLEVDERRTSSSSGGPSSAGSPPRSRWAAAGARMSRPWKVGETAGRRSAGLRISQIPDGSRPRSTPPIRPLSGRTNHWPSTVDRDQPPVGPDAGVDHGQVDRPGRGRRRRSRPARTPLRAMFWGAIAWLTSTSCVPGARPSTTPFIAAT